MIESYIMVARILIETAESFDPSALLAKRVLLERAQTYVDGAISEINKAIAK